MSQSYLKIKQNDLPLVIDVEGCDCVVLSVVKDQPSDFSNGGSHPGEWVDMARQLAASLVIGGDGIELGFETSRKSSSFRTYLSNYAREQAMSYENGWRFTHRYFPPDKEGGLYRVIVWKRPATMKDKERLSHQRKSRKR